MSSPDGAASDPIEPAPWPALLAASLAVVVLFLSSPAPPMADLPQHEAQVALWRWLDGGDAGLAAQLQLNWLTPYLGYDLAGRALGLVLPLHRAFQLLALSGVLLAPLALLALLRRTGGDPWWALLGVPFAFGFAFAWGFLNYHLAFPVVVLAWARLLDWLRSGTRRDALALGALGLLALLCHLLAWGLLLGAGLALIALWPELSPGARLRRSLPLLAPLPLVVLWLTLSWLSWPATRLPTLWRTGPERLAQLPEALVGVGPLATVTLGLTVLALGLGGRLAPGLRWRAAVGGVALLTVLGPERLGGTFYVAQRAAVYLLPGLLLLLQARGPGRERRLARAILVLLAVGTPLSLVPAWSRFGREVEAVDALLTRVGPGEPLFAHVPLAERQLPGLSGAVLGHLHARVQVERPVPVEYTFCRSFPCLVVQRPGAPPFDLDPARERLRPHHRWFLLRSREDPRQARPDLVGPPWRLVDQRGAWWLCRREGPD